MGHLPRLAQQGVRPAPPAGAERFSSVRVVRRLGRITERAALARTRSVLVCFADTGTKYRPEPLGSALPQSTKQLL